MDGTGLESGNDEKSGTSEADEDSVDPRSISIGSEDGEEDKIGVSVTGGIEVSRPEEMLVDDEGN